MAEPVPLKRNAENVQVIVRCRPMNSREIEEGVEEILKCSEKRKSIEVALKTNKNFSKNFYFDAVFGADSTQRDVYQTAVHGIVEQVLMGYNCTIFAYGQTGTGKTYTMEGRREITSTPVPEQTSASQRWKSSKEAGIISRAVHHIFESLEKSTTEYSVRVSHLELYNEELCDLLNPENKNLKLYEEAGANGRVTVHSLEEVSVYNPQDIFNILERSWEERRTAETHMNKASSRSHCIFSITIHTKEASPEGEDLIKIGKLNLVDLAGSENIGRSGADKVQLRKQEAGMINKSLLTLGRVITSLTEGSPHVPYRESKLTRLLQDSLGGATKTCIIATISPASDSLDETLSTLDYAFRAKNIKNRPEVNQKMSKREVIMEYNQEITQLRGQLDAMRKQVGVYLPTDTYNQMEKDMQDSRDRIQELEDRIEKKEKEFAELQEIFDRQANVLDRTEKKLSETKDTLEKTTDQLKTTEAELGTTKETLDEHKYVLKEHQDVESQLHEQGQVLFENLNNATSDITGLFAKIGRKDNLETDNSKKTDEFRAALTARMQEAEQKATQFIQAQTEKFAQLKLYIDDFVKAKNEEVSGIERAVGEFYTGLKGQLEALQQDSAKQTAATSENFDQVATTQSKFAKQMSTQIAGFVKEAEAGFASLREKFAANQTSVAQWTVQRKKHVQELKTQTHEFTGLQRTRLGELKAEVSQATEVQNAALSQQQAALKSFEETQRQETAQFQQSLISQVEDALKAFVENQNKTTSAVMAAVRESLGTVQASTPPLPLLFYLVTDPLFHLVAGVSHSEKHGELAKEATEASSNFDRAFASQSADLTEQFELQLANQSEHLGEFADIVKQLSSTTESRTEAVSELVDARGEFLTQLTTTAKSTLKDNQTQNNSSVESIFTAASESLETDLTSALEAHQASMEEFSQRWSMEIAAGRKFAETYGSEYSQQTGAVQQQIQGFALQNYQITGETPQKKSWKYPTQFSKTRAYPELVVEFQAKKAGSWVPPAVLPTTAQLEAYKASIAEPMEQSQSPVDLSSDSDISTGEVQPSPLEVPAPVVRTQASKPPAPAQAKLAAGSRPKFGAANAKGAVVQPIRKEPSATLVKRSGSQTAVSAPTTAAANAALKKKTGATAPRPAVADVTNVSK